MRQNVNAIRTGIILNVERYDECVSFYQSLFGLAILFTEEHGDFRLTCFQFGTSYLMIETEGFAKPEGKSIRESAAKLRFHVADIDKALATVRAHGIAAEVITAAWGSTINIHDPDGNRVGIRDEELFLQQLKQ